jgi:hypothetical protein
MGSISTGAKNYLKRKSGRMAEQRRMFGVNYDIVKKHQVSGLFTHGHRGAPYGNHNAAGPHKKRTTLFKQHAVISSYTKKMKKLYGWGW